jgi:glycine/D-amino acid oxidase-like deaminating enzyme/nitrite reductase/ring-hydroxylating ferredoxin subunit
MSSKTKQGQSPWQNASPPKPSTLTADAHAAACVVGAGIAGLSTAYELAKRGLAVVVLDANEIGAGETAFTTAHLANVIDDRFFEVEKVHGHEGSRLAAQSHGAAIDRIEAIARAENIDCDFRRLDGYLFDPLGPASGILSQEITALQHAGYEAFELLPEGPGPARGVPCLRFPNQGQFHPLKYLAGVARAVERMGGRLFGGAHVAEVRGGETARVVTRDGRVVTAGCVVVATNTPVNDVVAIHTKQAPYTTYALAAAVPRDSVPRALYWDTLDPYHYVRLAEEDGATLLVVGGEDHKTGQADDGNERWARLEDWARRHIPSLGPVRYRWSGQVMETIDGLGFIGRNPGDAPNVYIATGDSGMGMTHGTLAGMLLADLITGQPNPWVQLYDPARKPVSAAWDYLKENLNVAAQYGDWVTGGDVADRDAVASGHGAVVRRGLSKVAVYRDDNGTVHECSAVCTHLGCIVHWNDGEQTWDCPCHGSRFSKEGRVLHGPAVKDLAPIQQPAEATT